MCLRRRGVLSCQRRAGEASAAAAGGALHVCRTDQRRPGEVDQRPRGGAPRGGGGRRGAGGVFCGEPGRARGPAAAIRRRVPAAGVLYGICAERAAAVCGGRRGRCTGDAPTGGAHRELAVCADDGGGVWRIHEPRTRELREPGGRVLAQRLQVHGKHERRSGA